MHGLPKSQTWLSHWTITYNPKTTFCPFPLKDCSKQMKSQMKLKQRKPKQNPHILNECVLTMLWLSAWNHLWRFSHGRTSLVAQKVKHLPTVRGTQVQSLGQEDLLKKEMATHSSILAWKISWTEVPGGVQSMGSQRVKHDWATSFSLFSFSVKSL